ncbi:thioredoxin-like protein [Fusarium oxysporum]|nr:thioredoxin-like protein [Fusarium oxysporum]
MVVHEIHSMEEFKDALEKHPLVLVDFWATWSGPCQLISPVIENLLLLDIDAVREVSDELGIQTLPITVMYKDGTKCDEVHTGFLNTIEELLKKHVERDMDTVKQQTFVSHEVQSLCGFRLR